MTSINTNTAAMTALQSLQATNKNLETTQNRISTGFKVGSAQDNAAYWSIATTMKSDNKALSAVEDSLGIGSSLADVAYTGLDSMKDVLDEMKKKVVAAQQPGVDKTKIQSEMKQLQDQLVTISTSASFNGTNWLSDTAGTSSIVSSFTRDSTGTTAVSTIDVTTQQMLSADGSTGTLANAYAVDVSSSTDLAADLDTIETAFGATVSYAADIGAAKSRIDIQKTFTSNLMSAIDRGVGTLVDADMTEESTRLSALQTQQQLGVQALSIANSSTQTLLSLFRG